MLTPADVDPVHANPLHRTLAIYRNMDSGIEIVAGERTERHSTQYLRVSGFSHVAFPPLTEAELRTNLARLDERDAHSAQQRAQYAAELRILMQQNNRTFQR